jgi:hypothetical protein
MLGPRPRKSTRSLSVANTTAVASRFLRLGDQFGVGLVALVQAGSKHATRRAAYAAVATRGLSIWPESPRHLSVLPDVRAL